MIITNEHINELIESRNILDKVIETAEEVGVTIPEEAIKKMRKAQAELDVVIEELREKLNQQLREIETK